jgi:hypothetical protein
MSLDQHKALELFAAGSATLTNYSTLANDGGKDKLKLGEWRYDAASKKYLITLDGEAIAYSLISPDHISTCMLIKGELATADLTASWFSFEDDPGDYVDPHDR